MTTLVDFLISRVTTDGALPKNEWLSFPGSEPRRDTVSWLTLAQRSCDLADRLQPLIGRDSVAEHPRVGILLPTSREYWIAFLACIVSRSIAVPLFPPNGSHDDTRIVPVLASCRPSVLLTDHASEVAVRKIAATAAPGCPVLVVDDSLSDGGFTLDELVERLQGLGTRPEDVAYLQYTSGSTSRPSGAMVTHAGFAENLDQVRKGVGADVNHRCVSWLPLFHDMGLVIALGMSLAHGTATTMMAPEAFLMRPSRWLAELGAGDPTFAAGPNFMFDYSVQRFRPDQAPNLDLANVQWILNGSEPVHRSSVEAFQTTFAPFGLREHTVRPAYGLAEATVYVSSLPRLRVVECSRHGLAGGVALSPENAEDRVEVIDCGPLADDLDGVAVDPSTRQTVPDGRVGELWLRGRNMAVGYWGDPVHSREAFTHSPAGDDGKGLWFHTGDFVFFVDDHLHVVGRLKAMLIVDGRNHYSEDLEYTVQTSDPRIRPGRVAVVGTESNGLESALVMAECRGGLAGQAAEDLASKISRELTQMHGIRVHSVHLCNPGTLPLTSSGKIQRSLAHEQLLASGELAMS